MLSAGHVDDGVEGHHRVEGLRREAQVGHVGFEKSCRGTCWRASFNCLAHMSTPVTAKRCVSQRVTGTPAPQPRSSTAASSGQALLARARSAKRSYPVSATRFKEEFNEIGRASLREKE